MWRWGSAMAFVADTAEDVVAETWPSRIAPEDGRRIRSEEELCDRTDRVVVYERAGGSGLGNLGRDEL
jgi:hypothetical protein